MPNAVEIDGILTGGDPSNADLKLLSSRGYKTVIDLRTASEMGVEDDHRVAKEQGMKVVHIPVAGADGLTREAVDELHGALSDNPQKVVLHCASGNRVGAILALRAAWIEGKDPEAALALGKRAGMTRLEDAVKELLEK
jgi:uncharacterized protein (TIGR01244 family)